uniref:Uncharacterized protein n=1 Tax=Corethron hystrix TaxID=216773 RepID=A0A7S1BNP8_9STRA|mmetsp:Transcript_35537/g.82502  ORF Transcript_35537/g.82502 Transcript_35537/m.82502 type:complete len:802 (+) Transcript_35537:303-2708(+)
MASQFFAVVVFFFSVGSVVMTTLVSMSALFFSSSSITSKNEGFAVSAFDGRGRYSLHPHRSQAIKYCTFSSKMSPGIICPRGRALMLMSSESEDDSTNRRIFLRTAATASTAAVASGIFCDAAVAMSTPTQQLRWLPDPINPRRNGLPLTTPESVYPLKFVTYLSRFLLNFDRSCRRWWFASAGKIDKELGAEAVALERERQFGAFAASVEVGLRDYLDREGPNRLLQNLLTKYGSEGYIAVDYGSRSARESMEARRQIALLFGLMEASDMQPVEALTGLLAVIENATIVEVDVEDGGSGYAPGYGSPRVYFPPPEAGAGNIVVGGKQGKEQTPVGVVGEKFRMASGTAIMRPSGAILRIDLINHGSGYTKAPLVTVSPPKNIDGYVNSRSAQATATLFTRGANKGKIMRIDLIDGGMGYVEDEKIEVKVELPEGRVFDERGTQAVAKAIMELKVGSIEITDGGSGYAAERPLLLGVDPPPITARVNLNDKLVFLTNREIAERAANKNDSGQCVGRGCYDRNVIAYAYAGSNRTSYAAARNEQDSTWLERMEAAVEGKDYIGETAKFRAYAVNVGDKKNVRGMGATSDGGPTAGSVIELPFWTGESSASSRLLALLPSGVGLVFDRKVKRYILMNGDNSSSLRQVTPSSTNILQPIEFYFGPRGRNPIERQKKLDLSTTLRISASGAICASVVHTALTPIDVVKTKMQTNPAEYPDPVRSLKKLVDEEGIRSFFNGWQPTFLGFFVWGGFAYISTEYFRRLIIDFVGVGATTLEVPIILAAAATSAFFGSFLIAPFETVFD